jgi:hypothetical protein
VTPSVSSKGQGNASEASKGLAEAGAGACTPACTKASPEELAAAIQGLSGEERARLVALLLAGPGK